MYILNLELFSRILQLIIILYFIEVIRIRHSKLITSWRDLYYLKSYEIKLGLCVIKGTPVC